MIGVLKGIEEFLAPDFGTEHNGPALGRAFRLLIRVVLVFGMAIVLWSYSVGFLQSVRWITAAKQPPLTLWDWHAWQNWLALAGGTLVVGSKLLGIAGLMAMAAGLAGGFIGFLFGLPSRAAEAPTPTNGDLASRKRAAARWALSTNLIQITDWLTKIIIGVSLVEAKQLLTAFMELCDKASMRLHGGMFGSDIVVPAVLLGAAVLGFKLCNLYTQLFLSRLIAQADDSLGPNEEATVTILDMPSTSGAVAPPVAVTKEDEKFKQTAPSVAPTTEQLRSAVQVSEAPLDSVNGYEAVYAWARGHAVLNEYDKAAAGYRKLLPLMTAPSAEILSEIGRTFFQAGSFDDAKVTLARAWRGAEAEPVATRVSIARDLATLLLYDPKPEGYQAVLNMLDDMLVAADSSGQLALFRACANSQRYGYEKDLLEADRKTIRDRVIADVTLAIQRGQSKEWIRYLADPNASNKLPPGNPHREDDLEPLHEEVLALLGDGGEKLQPPPPPPQEQQ